VFCIQGRCTNMSKSRIWCAGGWSSDGPWTYPLHFLLMLATIDDMNPYDALCGQEALAFRIHAKYRFGRAWDTFAAGRPLF